MIKEKISIEKYVRTPIIMEQLIQISQDELDVYNLYVNQDIDYINEKTIVFLDNPIEVDDNDNEIYPEFFI